MTDSIRNLEANLDVDSNVLSSVALRANDQPCSAADLVVSYLEALDIEYVYGVPGGNIEPFYDALLRSERRGGVRPIVARHETGAAFMADGYARNSGKIGVCCATTGPGATNLITGVASAYENRIPLLVITAQTSLASFGRRVPQESSDTAVDTVGIFKHCTGYNSLVSHVSQMELKLVAAMMTAITHSCPVHLSVPLDVFRAASSARAPSYDIDILMRPSSAYDDVAVGEFCRQLDRAKKVVFVLGAGCMDAMPLIIDIALVLGAKIVTTPDGKGLISPYHPQFVGVIGLGGHRYADDILCADATDTVVAVGTTPGEWLSVSWDQNASLNVRLIHIEPFGTNVIRPPMARLHVRGGSRAIFQVVAETLDIYHRKSALDAIPPVLEPGVAGMQNSNLSVLLESDVVLAEYELHERVKPQWMMTRLTQMFPPHTRYLADTGNSVAWAVHYLHPFDRRFAERRAKSRSRDGKATMGNERRSAKAGLFQSAVVGFASMGWALGASIGAAMASPKQPVVCIIGDGSLLMSGQEITVALQEQLSIVFIVLNDSSLGTVNHGQLWSGAEIGAHELPEVDFCAMAAAMGVRGKRISCHQDLLELTTSNLFEGEGPLLLDVLIDKDEIPPIGARVEALQA